MQCAYEMNIWIHAYVETLPQEGHADLISQLRRAGDSAVRNIGEGAEFRSRMTDGQFLQLMGTAQGSTHELVAQLSIAKKQKLGDEGTLMKAENKCIETSGMLAAITQPL
jgi:four helix bundle protein